MPAIADGGARRGALGWLVLSSAVSGVASLVAQVVWVRRLGELFGSGPVSVAVVLSLFFAGLGLGARGAGPLADRRRGPIGLVVGLELAAAAAALLFLPAVVGIERAWLALASSDDAPAAALLIKVALAALVLVPPSFAMGAQLPALARHALRRPAALGRRVALLYGANTLGAAAGAALAGFLLLPFVGPIGALLAAAAAHLLAAAAAWRGRMTPALAAPLDRTGVYARDEVLEAQFAQRRAVMRASASRRRTPAAAQTLLLAAAALSGVVALGLEVVWTRALAARLSGTVYSYAAVLTAFLLALAFGALVAARLGARGSLAKPARGFAALGAAWLGLGAGALLSGALLAHLPRLGSASFAPHGLPLWIAHGRELLLALVVMAPALFFAGLQLPLLIALVGRGAAGAGRAVGRVLAVNAAGTALAPALVGLGLIPAVGLGGALAILGWTAVLFGMALVASGMRALRRPLSAVVVRTLPALLVAGGAQLALGDGLISWHARAGARLVAYRDGPAAGVAVVDEPGGNRVLELDGDYRLGDLATRFAQARQGLLARLIAPDFDAVRDPVLHIGLGTGTSAAAILQSGARKLVVAEIVPDLDWTLPYFAAANGDLGRRFAAGDARFVGRDAREFVRLSPARFGLVVADLFVPWRAGEGAMYTREHFAAVRASLLPHGRFVQWLPVYQLGLADLRTIAATFVEVFPGAGMMWLYFNAEQPAIALVGARAALGPPDVADVERALGAIDGLGAKGDVDGLRALLEPQNPALEVAGSWLAGGELLAEWVRGAPLETRARPRIEFHAPRALLVEARTRTSRTLAGLLDLAVAAAERDSDPARGRRREALALLLGALDARAAGDRVRAEELAAQAVAKDGTFAFAAGVLARWRAGE